MNTCLIKNFHRRFTLTAVLLAITLGFSPQQSRADDLTWTIAPYLWVSDVAMDVAVSGEPILGLAALGYTFGQNGLY
jgi:hypothetical protein